MSVLAVALDDSNREEMEGWANFIAAALNEPLEFVRILGDGPKELVFEGGEDGGVKTASLSRSAAEQVIAAHIDATKPSLLVADVRGGLRGFRSKLAGGWFGRARCDTLCLRFPEEGGRGGGRVLMPTSGGPNAKGALALSAALAAHREGGRVVPLFVEPDTGELSGDVGRARLDSILARAGARPDGDLVEPAVSVDDDPEAAIHRAAEDGEYDLILLGAPGCGGLLRALFGSLPDRLLNSGERVAVGVFRRAPPIGERVREAAGRWLHLRVPQLDRAARVALFENLETNARWSFDFMVLICLSTALAGLGLMLDSAAVVIGAMLVAPLMTPLLGAGLALVQGNFPLMRQCAQSILYGFCAALAIGVLLGLAGGFYGLTHQMEMRGSPDVPDMVVAFLSGVAASYCIARPRLSSALAGVAIAAALVPPIATSGIALALGEPRIARGAALLFGTNVVFIILGAACNFFVAGVRPKKRGAEDGPVWQKRALLVLMAAGAVLTIPLGSVLIEKIAGAGASGGDLAVRTEVATERRLRDAFEEALSDTGAEVRDLEVVGTDAGWRVTVTARAQRGTAVTVQKALLAAAAEELEEPVELRVAVVEYDLVTEAPAAG